MGGFGFLKKATNLLGGPGQRPADAPTMVVLVVGGVAPQELAELSEVISRMRVMGVESPKQVLVGGTCLATPGMVARRVLGGPGR